MLPFRAILLDKDDTLIDLAAFWEAPIRRTAQQLAKQLGLAGDAPLLRELQLAAGILDGTVLPAGPVAAGTNRDIARAWAKVLSAQGHTLPVTEDVLAEAIQQACLLYGQIRPRGDFATVLHTCKNLHLPLGVATSDSYQATMHCLQTLELDDCFDLVLTADRVAHAKPHPEMAQIFSAHCGVPLAQIAMVGDTANDMLFAHNSGMIGILYQPDASPFPLPKGAAYCIHTPAQLLELSSGVCL